MEGEVARDIRAQSWQSIDLPGNRGGSVNSRANQQV